MVGITYVERLDYGVPHFYVSWAYCIHWERLDKRIAYLLLLEAIVIWRLFLDLSET